MQTVTVTATLEPFAEGGDHLRDRLRDAIARVQSEQARLSSLEEGQSRAHASLREASYRLDNAQDALRKANQEEPSRLANAFVSNGAINDDPISAPKLKVSAAQGEIEYLDKIEAALASEIARQSTLRTLRVTQYSIMAELIVSSGEYQLLIQSHAQAWKQLRSVKEALRVVTAGLHGYLDQRHADEAHRSEPMEPRRVWAFAGPSV